MLEPLKRALSVPLAAVLLFYEALDALFGPVVRPVVARLAALGLFRRIGDAIAALPPYAALALLAVPFAAIEPFKFVGLYWIAEGRIVTGTVTLACAYVLSFFVCERIFHAARASILSIGWFARGFSVLTDLRDRAHAWAKQTAAWRAAAGLRDRVRAATGRA